jgi:hypothetical protein
LGGGLRGGLLGALLLLRGRLNGLDGPVSSCRMWLYVKRWYFRPFLARRGVWQL